MFRSPQNELSPDWNNPDDISRVIFLCRSRGGITHQLSPAWTPRVNWPQCVKLLTCPFNWLTWLLMRHFLTINWSVNGFDCVEFCFRFCYLSFTSPPFPPLPTGGPQTTLPASSTLVDMTKGKEEGLVLGLSLPRSLNAGNFSCAATRNERNVSRDAGMSCYSPISHWWQEGQTPS